MGQLYYPTSPFFSPSPALTYPAPSHSRLYGTKVSTHNEGKYNKNEGKLLCDLYHEHVFWTCTRTRTVRYQRKSREWRDKCTRQHFIHTRHTYAHTCWKWNTLDVNDFWLLLYTLPPLYSLSLSTSAASTQEPSPLRRIWLGNLWPSWCMKHGRCSSSVSYALLLEGKLLVLGGTQGKIRIGSKYTRNIVTPRNEGQVNVQPYLNGSNEPVAANHASSLWT